MPDQCTIVPPGAPNSSGVDSAARSASSSRRRKTLHSRSSLTSSRPVTRWQIACASLSRFSVFVVIVVNYSMVYGPFEESEHA